MKKLYIDPSASQQAKQFIQAAQQILFSVNTAPVIKQMITGAKTLAQSAAPFIAGMVVKLESKLGPLNPTDEAVVVLHICGYIADMAHELKDPDARDPKKAAAQIMTAVKPILQGGQQPQQAQQPQQQPPLQQLGGGMQ